MTSAGAGPGRIFTVAMIITVVSMLGAYNFFIEFIQVAELEVLLLSSGLSRILRVLVGQDSDSTSAVPANGTEIAQLRAQNKKLLEDLEDFRGSIYFSIYLIAIADEPSQRHEWPCISSDVLVPQEK